MAECTHGAVVALSAHRARTRLSSPVPVQGLAVLGKTKEAVVWKGLPHGFPRGIVRAVGDASAPHCINL